MRAECRLGLFTKKGSSTSDCAYLPINLHKRERHWHGTAADGGVVGESTRDVLDLDEAQFKLETQDRKFRKVSGQKRCDARGKYKKGAGAVSLLMVVSGDEQDQRGRCRHVEKKMACQREERQKVELQWRHWRHCMELEGRRCC